MGLERMLTNIYHNSFNIKFAIISAGFNGPIAAAVNHNHSSLEMLTAGTTQAVSSFISTGVTARLVQHFSPFENKYFSYFFGSTIPATATFLLSYVGHYLNDTPEALYSCFAPTIISLTTSLVTNYITRKGYMLPKNYPKKEL
jgi:hypothetical protein